MVTFSAMGRLANYIYQFGAAYGYAKRHDLEFTVPFVERDQKWHPVYFKHLRNPKYNHALPNILVQEKKHGYHELPFQESWRDCNITLEGYFQSYLFFTVVMDEFRELIGFNYETEEGICGLHIRRGDFLLYPDKHILPPDEFYEQATYFVRSIKGITKIRVYSDDIPYCKTYFIQGRFGFEYEFSEGQNELQDFEGLMNCESIITAASSFSILAGTLSTTPNKLVVCPHETKFFGPVGKHLDMSTMYPPHFYTIDYVV